MVVTCYSRACNRLELPIFSASRKRVCVRTCVQACVRIPSRRHGPRAAQEQERTYMSAECERICRLLWCLRLPLEQRRRKRRRWRRRETRWWRRKASCFPSLSFFFSRFSPSSITPVSLCTLLSYSFISFLLRYSMNEVGLLHLILGSMYSFTTTFATNDRSVISFSGRLEIRKTRENFNYTWQVRNCCRAFSLR